METKLKKLILTLFSIFFLSNLIFSQPSNKLDPIDVFDLEYISNPEISPNGDMILFQRNFKDIMTDKNLSNLWLVNFDGSDMRPITTGSIMHHLQNGLIMERCLRLDLIMMELLSFIINLENNSTQKLTNSHSSIGNVEWSYDDKHLYLTHLLKRKMMSSLKCQKNRRSYECSTNEIDDMVYRYDGRGIGKVEIIKFLFSR